MEQITKTKTQNKTGATKGRTSRKPQQASAPAQAPAQTLTHALIPGVRPERGSRLFAHTVAFLTLAGMPEGRAIPQATAKKVIGETAVKYHKAAGRFEDTAEGIKLTESGRAFFATRGASAEYVAAYMSALSGGDVPESVAKNGEGARKALA